AAGRFTSGDSIGMWGDEANLGNRSVFVGANPWSFTDPMGAGATAAKESRSSVSGSFDAAATIPVSGKAIQTKGTGAIAFTIPVSGKAITTRGTGAIGFTIPVSGKAIQTKGTGAIAFTRPESSSPVGPGGGTEPSAWVNCSPSGAGMQMCCMGWG